MITLSVIYIIIGVTLACIWVSTPEWKKLIIPQRVFLFVTAVLSWLPAMVYFYVTRKRYTR